MALKTVRRTINLTPEMHNLLVQIASKYGRETTESHLIREAIRLYLDEQADLVGSRRHFQKSLQLRLDRLEAALLFQMNVLVYLLAAALGDRRGAAIEEAIIAAKRDGADVSAAALAQIEAIRALKLDDD